MALVPAKLLVAEDAYFFIMSRTQAKLDEAVQAIGHRTMGVLGGAANLADLDRLCSTKQSGKKRAKSMCYAPVLKRVASAS